MNSIPMKYDGHINLDVNVEKKIRGNFVFDTGWNGITLDSLFCEKNCLSFNTSEIELGGIGNSRSTFQLITDTIHFQFSNKENAFTTKCTMINLKNIIGPKIDGISGIQTFANKIYKIDYESQNIVFVDSINGYNLVNAKFEGGFIYIDLSIILKNKNAIKGWFLIDTGSDQTILNSHLLITDGIHNAIGKKKFFAKGGIGGDSNGYFLPVEEINIGKYNIKNVITTVSSDTLGMLANTDFMGIIGNDILDDFHIIFDHQKEKIWVKPNKNFNKNKKKLFRGVSFYDNGEKWVVAGIVEDSEAYKLGVRMNDQILKINNILVGQIDLNKFVDKLKANDVLNLRIKRDGEEKEIIFKLNVFLKT